MKKSIIRWTLWIVIVMLLGTFCHTASPLYLPTTANIILAGFGGYFATAFLDWLLRDWEE